MAQHLRFPLLLKRGSGITSQICQRRQTSQIAQQRQNAAITNTKAVIKKQAMVQNQDEVLRTRKDFGVLHETFIMPTGPNRPKILSKDFLRLHWKWVKQRAQDFGGVMYYKFSAIKPRPVIRFRATKAAAIGLHRQMYEAFASGDTKVIEEICCEGLRDTLLTRIANRRPGEKVKWRMVKEGRSRVVSHRAAAIVANTGLRQAVVKIKSTQTLTRVDKGKVVGSSGKKKDLTEYVVIQKKTVDGVEEPWMIWGTTKETTMEELGLGEEEALSKN